MQLALDHTNERKANKQKANKLKRNINKVDLSHNID